MDSHYKMSCQKKNLFAEKLSRRSFKISFKNILLHLYITYNMYMYALYSIGITRNGRLFRTCGYCCTISLTHVLFNCIEVVYVPLYILVFFCILLFPLYYTRISEYFCIILVTYR